ncbi:MAG: hypothetical protein HN852_06220, partial [Euryarchaeota archaeon]|nr:hypothetical protein [Euryarchaeota archaeon]
MSSIMPVQKYLAATICLLFLTVPILNFIDSSEEIDSTENEYFSASKSVSGLNSPGSEKGNVFSNSVFEMNSDSPNLVLDNGSVVSFINGSANFSGGNVISISGQCSLLGNYSL